MRSAPHWRVRVERDPRVCDPYSLLRQSFLSRLPRRANRVHRRLARTSRRLRRDEPGTQIEVADRRLIRDLRCCLYRSCSVVPGGCLESRPVDTGRRPFTSRARTGACHCIEPCPALQDHPEALSRRSVAQPTGHREARVHQRHRGPGRRRRTFLTRRHCSPVVSSRHGEVFAQRCSTEEGAIHLEGARLRAPRRGCRGGPGRALLGRRSC